VTRIGGGGYEQWVRCRSWRAGRSFRTAKLSSHLRHLRKASLRRLGDESGGGQWVDGGGGGVGITE